MVLSLHPGTSLTVLAQRYKRVLTAGFCSLCRILFLSSCRALRMRRRKRAPAPPIFFPDVVTKELVDESEARALYDLFFSGCNLFVPLFDQTYDTFDDLRVRTPFTLDALLAIAAKVRAGPNPPGEVFRVCLAEAQGIARSTLFGPIVQKECVPVNFALSVRAAIKADVSSSFFSCRAAQAILLLATYSQNSYLPSGHALRAGLDFGLHRALDKLHQGHLGGRSDVEERELGAFCFDKRDSTDGKLTNMRLWFLPVVSSRIWLCIFWFVLPPPPFQTNLAGLSKSETDLNLLRPAGSIDSIASAPDGRSSCGRTRASHMLVFYCESFLSSASVLPYF